MSMYVPYDQAFYEEQADGSLRSAEVVADALMPWLQPTSVVDVGCGVGTWLKAFSDRGVALVHGLDGDYVDRRTLRIPAANFRAADLSKPLQFERRFDLALCLEVGEHLPHDASTVLVDSLVSAADIVLFSAAVPRQGGTHHVNEQWPAYWFERFRAQGYVCCDWLRPLLWMDRRVEWWYAQNVMLYVASHRMRQIGTPPWAGRESTGGPMPLVHPLWYLGLPETVGTPPGVRASVRFLASALARAMRRRWSR
jgi:SAM-dependent methyltransferase